MDKTNSHPKWTNPISINSKKKIKFQKKNDAHLQPGNDIARCANRSTRTQAYHLSPFGGKLERACIRTWGGSKGRIRTKRPLRHSTLPCIHSTSRPSPLCRGTTQPGQHPWGWYGVEICSRPEIFNLFLLSNLKK